MIISDELIIYLYGFINSNSGMRFGKGKGVDPTIYGFERRVTCKKAF